METLTLSPLTDVALVPADARELARFLPGIWTRIGWIPPTQPLTRDQYIEASDALWEWERGRPWCVGDWILYGERLSYGQMYAQAMEVTGLSYERLAHYVFVCKRFEFCRRKQNLTFAHHEVVAPLRFSDEEQDWWLGQAEQNDWSAAELKRQVDAWEAEARNDKLAAEGVITDVETEPQLEWLDDGGDGRQPGEDDGPSPSEIAPVAMTGGWVECPFCQGRFPWRRGMNDCEGGNNDEES